MNILQVDPSHEWRGGQQQVLYLLQGLTQLGYSPVLAAPLKSPLAERSREAGITVLPLEARGDADLWGAHRLRQLAKPYKGLHLHSGRAHGLAALAYGAGGKRPRILVSRRVDFPPKKNWFSRLKYGPGVDAYIAVSRRVARILMDSGISGDRVCVVHSGIDLARVQGKQDRAGLARELGVDPEVRLVGFLGALVHHKAPDILLKSLEYLPSSAHLVFAGQGPMLPELQQEASRWPGRVHFLGFRSDLPRLIASVDVFVLASRTEGLGTSILDAMAAGTPVVGAAAGGIPEMIESGVSGLLVPPESAKELGAAISRVVADPGLAGDLVAGGRRRVEEFSAERMVDGTLEVYRAHGLLAQA